MSDTDQTLKEHAGSDRSTETASRLALIRSHTLNELAVSPQSVTARDRVFLLGEIKRLRAREAELEALVMCLAEVAELLLTYNQPERS